MTYDVEPTYQTYRGWAEFYNKPVDEKLDFFKSNGRIFDIVFAQQFDRSFLDFICYLADLIRQMAKTKMGSK